jgi:hypothetical protein
MSSNLYIIKGVEGGNHNLFQGGIPACDMSNWGKPCKPSGYAPLGPSFTQELLRAQYECQPRDCNIP